MTSRLEIVTVIEAPAQRCFDLSRDIGAHVDSMHASGERAVAGVTSGLIGLGEDVTWRARHFGIVWEMTARITAFHSPVHFADEMQRGPFASFRHDHHFDQQGATTTMRDVVHYRLALGPLGAIADAAFVARHLRRLLEGRGRYLREIAASSPLP